MFDKVLPKKGGWIMVKGIIPVDMPIEPLSIFFAKPKKVFWDGHFTMPGVMPYDMRIAFEDAKKRFGEKVYEAYIDFQRGRVGKFDAEEKAMLGRLDDEGFDVVQRVEIRTPFGDCCIEPHEYNMIEIDKYLDQIDGEHLKMNMFGENNQIASKELGDKLFYLRSRGIPKLDALKLLLPQLDQNNVLWLSFHEEYQRHFTRDYHLFEIKKEKFLNKKQKVKA